MDIREKRYKSVEEAAIWADDRRLTQRAAEYEPASAAPYTGENPASGAGWDDKSTFQVKERKEGQRTSLAKSTACSSKSICFYLRRWDILKLTWKTTQTLKPVALIVGSSPCSVGDLECGIGTDGVLDSRKGNPECTPLGKARKSSPFVKSPPERSLA